MLYQQRDKVDGIPFQGYWRIISLKGNFISLCGALSGSVCRDAVERKLPHPERKVPSS
jgi:hypothetical protein